MAILIDTHTLLWYYWNSPQLSLTAQKQINDPTNTIYVSIASLWEIAIKVSQEKLSLIDSLSTFFVDAVEGYGFRVLPIEYDHLIAMATLPFHHKDPFDRLLIAQSRVEEIPIISADIAFDAYPITRIW